MNSNAISTLNHLVEDSTYKTITAPLSDAKDDPIHNLEVFKVIMLDLVKPLTNYSSTYVLDFDDTLWSTKTIDQDWQVCIDNLYRLSRIKSQARALIFSGNKISRYKKLVDDWR